MTQEPTKQLHTVAVSGGELTVAEWGGPNAAPVLAIHGITANHTAWQPFARLSDLRVIAPDLRGRGASAHLPGPYGMGAHAEDLHAVLTHLRIDRVPLIIGHSMGGFVSLVFAQHYGAGAVLLVDGGLPLPRPADIGDEELLQATIGPAAARLEMTFPTREAYADYWRSHPALEEFTADVACYVDYDLTGAAPNLRPAGNLAAIQADVADLARAERIVEALGSLDAPTRFLRAPRGLLNDEPGLYPPAEARRLGERFGIEVVDVGGVNHYTITLGQAGAEAVTAHAHALLRERSTHGQ